ncbi:MAG: hypothetical protein AAF631_10505, partial [Pseudomonadota bacterium]
MPKKSDDPDHPGDPDNKPTAPLTKSAKAAQFAGLFLWGAGGGFLAQALGLPLPFMLGGLLATLPVVA